MGPTYVWSLLCGAHKLPHRGLSLVPRPSLSFLLLAVHLTTLQAIGSWARAWKGGYKGLKPECLFPYFSSHWTRRSLNWPRRSLGQFMWTLELIIHPLTISGPEYWWISTYTPSQTLVRTLVRYNSLAHPFCVFLPLPFTLNSTCVHTASYTFLFRKTNDELIVTGPYGLVRHPMYTTSILGVWITPTMVSILDQLKQF